MKIKVVVDTSSLVSLETVKLIGKILKIAEIVVPSEVVKELEEISHYEDVEGRSAKRILDFIKENIIRVCRVKDIKKINSLLSVAIDRGEAECLVCCIENKIKNLIIDDVDAMYSLEETAIKNEIETNISFWLLTELINKRIISKKEAYKLIKKMIKIREWEGGILEVLAKKYLENV